MCFHPGMNISGYSTEALDEALAEYRSDYERETDDYYKSYYKTRVEWLERQIQVRKDTAENAIKQAEYMVQKAAARLAAETREVSTV